MSRRAFDLETEKKIIAAYEDEGLTLRQLAAKFGGTDVSALNVLRRNGVARRPGGPPPKLRWTGSEEQQRMVVALYAELGSVREVARVAGVRTNRVSEVLLAHSVALKPGGRRVFTAEQDAQIAQLYAEGASLTALSKRFGSNAPTITGAIKRGGGTIRPWGRETFWTTERETYVLDQHTRIGRKQQDLADELGVAQTAISRMLARHGVRDPRKSGSDHHAWQGGRRLDENGYVWVLPQGDDHLFCRITSNGYVLEHRLVMGRALGRPLLPHETVHHVDGDHENNKLDNLQLRFGKHGKGVALECRNCGSHNVQPVPLKG